MAHQEAISGSSSLLRFTNVAAAQLHITMKEINNTGSANDYNARDDDGYETTQSEPGGSSKARSRRGRKLTRTKLHSNKETEIEALKAFAASGIQLHNESQLDHSTNKVSDRPSLLASQALAECGIQPDASTLISTLRGNRPKELHSSDQIFLLQKRRRTRKRAKGLPAAQLRTQKRDFFGFFSSHPELIMELAKHMSVNSILSIYSISKDFHEILNGHMSHIMKACAAYQSPESSRIFLFTLYDSLCMPDPVGRPHPLKPDQVRRVPSLRWLAMVSHREKAVRDILACMAREGHRMPKTMSLSLKKMWLTMDIATSARRVQLMHNENYWTDNDIYNIQLFLIKLDMRMNDPVDGPGDDGMKKLFLGQRGLTPLRDLLKRTRFTEILEITRLAIRYAYEPMPQDVGLTIFGIPPDEIGRGHLEGWGMGNVHLYRMDELVMREAVRRNLGLDDHMMSMMLWGYVDPITKENITPSAEELYMSDDDEVTTMENVKGKDKAVDDDGDVNMSDGSDWENDEEWETEDEDMPHESMPDDSQDAGAIGPSGWRRKHDDDVDDDNNDD